MKPMLNKNQLSQVLDQLTTDFAALLKSEGDQDLAKADPGEETAAEKTPEGSSADPPGEAAGAPPEASASPEGSPEASPEASPDGAPVEGAPDDGSGDPAADGQATPEVLQAEYAKLSPEELKMHLMAAQAAYMQLAGQESSAPGAPPPEASAPPPAMGKEELKVGDGSGKVKGFAKAELSPELETRLAKAEAVAAEVAGLKKALEEKDAALDALQKKMNEAATGMQNLLNRQQAARKAVTGISQAIVTKPGTEVLGAPGAVDVRGLSKAEITKKLTAVTAAGPLAKADSDLIKGFYAGTVEVEKLQKFWATN